MSEKFVKCIHIIKIMYLFHYYFLVNKIFREVKTKTQCWASRHGPKASRYHVMAWVRP